jgi:hypothetical protein
MLFEKIWWDTDCYSKVCNKLFFTKGKQHFLKTNLPFFRIGFDVLRQNDFQIFNLRALHFRVLCPNLTNPSLKIIYFLWSQYSSLALPIRNTF